MTTNNDSEARIKPQMEEEDDRVFSMVGMLIYKVNAALPITLSDRAGERIAEIIYDDLRDQNLVPGEYVSVAVAPTLFSPEEAINELRLNANKDRTTS